MRTLIRRAWLPALLVSMALPAAAEPDEASLDILVGTLEANRKALVAVNLKLDPAQAERFWPVYDRYDRERGEVRRRLLALVQEYTANFGAMSDEKASQLVDDYLAIERDGVEVRQRYHEPFAAVLPARTVLRLYQVENKIEAVLRYQLAGTIPVIGD